MENNLIKTLKELRKIEPDTEYSRKSRFIILNSGHEEPATAMRTVGFFDYLKEVQSSRLAISLEVGLLAVAVLFISIYYAGVYRDKTNLVVQADELNNSINLKLDDIRYMLLTSKTPLNHDDAKSYVESLEKAAKELEIAGKGLKDDSNLQKSLEQIKSAKEIILQIESDLKKKESGDDSQK